MGRREITDTEVLALAAISTTLRVDYEAEELEWEGSPFAWIRRRPSRQRGAIGERLVAGWLAAKDFDIVKSPDSQADRIVNGHRIEVKFSTLWRSGVYKFQQLRDQDYEFVVCLGISPFNAHCWILPKSEVITRWRAGDGIHSQHGGSAGRDTAWLSIKLGFEYDWLSGFGGPLGIAARKIEAYLYR